MRSSAIQTNSNDYNLGEKRGFHHIPFEPYGPSTRGFYAALVMSNVTVRLSSTSLSGLRVVGSQWVPESVIRRDIWDWYYYSSVALESASFDLDAGVHFAGEG